jgi:hypothetical protein
MLIPITGLLFSIESSASLVESYCGHEFAPMLNPPPWMKTKTGTRRGTVLGVTILRFRHSVMENLGSSHGNACSMNVNSWSRASGFCGHAGLQMMSIFHFQVSTVYMSTYPYEIASTVEPPLFVNKIGSANGCSNEAYLRPR